jgi:cobalt-zinc-cadmium efflux system membrane fusion protein
MQKKISSFIPILLIFAIACTEKKQQKEVEKKFELSDTMANMIEIDSAKLCAIDDALTLSGEVSYNENTVNKIFHRSSGQVIECKVTIGDKVQAGQVLAIIKSADIAGNYADLNSADADVKITKRQLDNTQSLYKNGIASEKELTEANQNYEKALAAKRKIESIISINGGKNSTAGGTYVLIAPTDGYIVEKKVNTGNFIRPDMGDYLFTISNLKDVWVYANVFEADIPKVKEGYTVAVTTFAYPNKIFKGKIDKVSEVLDPTNKALRVRVQLSNEGLFLKPQMFAKVIVTNEEKTKAICIPSKALITNNGKTYVVAFNGNKDIKVLEVTVLKSAGDITYITDGVALGQKIITKNALLLFGQLIKS